MSFVSIFYAKVFVDTYGEDEESLINQYVKLGEKNKISRLYFYYTNFASFFKSLFPVPRILKKL